jgi:hypothetical protein
MKSDNPTNQGEGDKASARVYNKHVREFIADGKVDRAADDARQFLERDPESAARAEASAKRGPRSTKVSVDELVAKGRNLIDRIRLGIHNLRARYARK